MAPRVALTFLALSVVSSMPALALPDKYEVTPEEHAACDADAYRLCSDSADQDQLLVCMKAHRSELVPRCRASFLAGLKKRHLQLD